MNEFEDMTYDEALSILDSETNMYTLKPNPVLALKYDGSEELAIAIEKVCNISYIEWDEGGSFSGLIAYTRNGVEKGTPEYVNEGDYLIDTDGGWYCLVPKEKFEFKYVPANTVSNKY